MSLESIIEKSKVDKQEVITTSIQLPKHLKEQMQSVCKENGITVNAFMVNLIDDVLNGDLKDKTTLEVVNKLSELIKQREELNKVHAETGGHQFIILENGQEVDLETRMNEVDLMIRMLKRGI